MHYRDPRMLRCVDKYDVRSYVEKGCGKYLNKLYQISNHAKEIDFDNLPNKFVIKTTSGGNGDNVLIIKEKSKLNIKETIETVNSWLHKNYSDTSREWAHLAVAKNTRIIVERYLENPLEYISSNIDSSSELLDYKFFVSMDKQLSVNLFPIDF